MGVLRTRSGNRFGQTLRRAVRAAAEVGDLFPADIGQRVALQPAAGNLGDGVGELNLAWTGHIFLLDERRVCVERFVPHANHERLGRWPQFFADPYPALSGCDRAVSDGFVNGAARIFFKVFQRAVVDQSKACELAHRKSQRITVLPARFLVLVAVAVSAPRPVAGMMQIAVGLGVHVARQPAFVPALPDVFEREFHGQWVHAVHAHPRHAVCQGFLVEMLRRTRLVECRADRVLIVLDEIHDRRVPQLGEVGRFVEHALVHRAVTEEADGHRVAPLHLLRPRHTGRVRHATGDDRVGAGDARRLVDQMHRAAAPAAAAFRQSHDLRQQDPHLTVHVRGQPVAQRIVIRGRTAGAQDFGEVLMMGAVRAGNLVRRPQRAAHAGGHAFLADAGVHRAVDAILGLEPQQRFLEAPNEDDLLQQPEQRGGRLRVPIGLFGCDLDQRRLDGERANLHCQAFT